MISLQKKLLFIPIFTVFLYKEVVGYKFGDVDYLSRSLQRSRRDNEDGLVPFPDGFPTRTADLPKNPFTPEAGQPDQREELHHKHHHHHHGRNHYAADNLWGFEPDRSIDRDDFNSRTVRREISTKSRTSKIQKQQEVETTTSYYEEVDPNHNGLLKGIGTIDVGFGVGVGVPGNDPVSVATRVGVGFGASGLAGGLPIGQNIYPRQGEWQSLNDYDGNKRTIVPDKAAKYYQAVREGRIRVPHYRPVASLVGVRSGIGIGTGTPQ